jgi:hypothetical protein
MGFFSIRSRFQNQPVAFKQPRHCRSLTLNILLFVAKIRRNSAVDPPAPMVLCTIWLPLTGHMESRTLPDLDGGHNFERNWGFSLLVMHATTCYT